MCVRGSDYINLEWLGCLHLMKTSSLDMQETTSEGFLEGEKRTGQ